MPLVSLKTAGDASAVYTCEVAIKPADVARAREAGRLVRIFASLHQQRSGL
jgi:hypothetical protein